MFNTTQIEYEVLRTFDSATLTGSFQNFGLPLDNPAVLIKMYSTSTSLVEISVDGINSHDICPAGGGWIYDVTSDSPNTGSIYRKKGTQYRVKGSAGTGLIYLVIQYVKQIEQ